jgi:hypothetical protein
LTPQWGDIPAKRWRMQPRPKAVTFYCRGERENSMELPFPVPINRFDQKNEMFKRSLWDEKMRPYARGFYEEVVYQQKIGFRKLDYVFRNATWNLEWGFGFGNAGSNSGLYAREGVDENCP